MTAKRFSHPADLLKKGNKNGHFRWAYVGCGRIAKNTARSILKGGHAITAVYTRTFEKALAFAEACGAKAYKSFDELLSAFVYFRYRNKRFPKEREAF